MKILTIIKIVVVTLCFIAIIFGVVYLKNMFVETQKTMIALTENIVATKIQENTALLEKRISQLDEVILNYTEARDQQIMDIGYSIAELRTVVERNVSGDHEYKSDTKDPKEQYFKMIYSKDTNGTKYPLAWAIFKPNRSEKWTVGIVPEWKIKSQVVLTEGKESEAIFNIWFENENRKETKGNKYPLAIADVEWVRREIKEKSFIFNPTLGLGAVSDLGEVYPEINLGIFTYGKTDYDFMWRFIIAGIGTNSEELFFDFYPAQYNLGQHLPIVKNLLIGPLINLDTELKYNFGFGINGIF